MVAILSFLAVIAVSLIIVRVATVALTHTGLSSHLARFQARSAFTGAGFTTNESEKVVQHPVRRRIIMMLMLLGNAGIVTAVSSLLLSFLGEETTWGPYTRGGLLIVGLLLLWWLAVSRWVDRLVSRIIHWALQRFTSVEARDYAGLLHLTGDYVVAELAVTEGDWLCGQKLQNLRLNSEGLLVLGIERTGGKYIGAPRGSTKLQTDETVILYGRRKVIEEIDNRERGRDGAWQHVRNVEEQKAIEASEADETDAEAVSETKETRVA